SFFDIFFEVTTDGGATWHPIQDSTRLEFRPMVTKSRAAEAKIGLGAMYTVESSFHCEYNTYGSRIERVGVELEGNQLLYSVGFPIDSTRYSGFTTDAIVHLSTDAGSTFHDYTAGA